LNVKLNQILTYILIGFLLVSTFGIFANSEGTKDWQLNEGEVNPRARGLSNTPWPCFGGNSQHTGLSGYSTADNPGKIKWKFETGGDIISSPVFSTDGTIHIGSKDGSVYAVYPNGTLKWEFETGDEVISSQAIDSNGVIYASSKDSYLYAINPDGSEKWKYLAGDSLEYSSPTISTNGTIFFCSFDYNLYAITPDGNKLWNFTTGDTIVESPAIGADGTIYFGSHDNYVYAINPNGTEKWKFETGDWVSSSPAVGADGTIYIGSNDYNLYAINPNGTEKWNFTTGDKVWTSPAIGSDGTIYFGSNDNNLYALYPNGTEKWSFFHLLGNVESSPTISSEGTIYYGANDGFFSALYPNGTEKWSLFLNLFLGFVSQPSIGSDGTVYVGSNDNYLYAINKAPPTAPINPEATSGNGFVQLTWDVPDDDGGDIITGYKILRRNESQSKKTLLASVGSTITSYNDTDVTNGIGYYYEVRAVNNVGDGEASLEVIGFPLTFPSKPLDIIVVAGDSYVLITWSAPLNDGGSPIIKYEVFKGKTSNEETYLTAISSSESYYNDTDVINGVVYYYYITAKNDLGAGPQSDEVIGEPKTYPDAPLDFAIISGDQYVLLLWDIPLDDGGDTITQYKIYRKEVNDPYELLITLDVPTTMTLSTMLYNDTTVTNDITYDYYVLAVNSIGDGAPCENQSAMPFKPIVIPLQPLGVTATAGVEHINISWKQPSYNGGAEILKYNIYRGTKSGELDFLQFVGGNIYNFTDDNVETNNTYYYQIRAVNVVGEGSVSLEVNAIPLKKDTDGDGVTDDIDAFPTDLAASVDTDGDKYPDSWNPGKSELDSNSGLTIDAYPNDPANHTKSNGDGGTTSDDKGSSEDKGSIINEPWFLIMIILIIVVIVVIIVFAMLKKKKPKDEYPGSDYPADGRQESLPPPEAEQQSYEGQPSPPGQYPESQQQQQPTAYPEQPPYQEQQYQESQQQQQPTAYPEQPPYQEQQDQESQQQQQPQYPEQPPYQEQQYQESQQQQQPQYPEQPQYPSDQYSSPPPLPVTQLPDNQQAYSPDQYPSQSPPPMTTCPQCKYQILIGTTPCPNCGIPLNW